MHELTELQCPRSQFIEEDKIVYIKIKELDKTNREWLEEKINYITTEHGTTPHYSRGALK